MTHHQIHPRTHERSGLAARPGSVGFGLVGLLVVLVIILVIYSVQTGGGGKSYPQQIAETKRQSVEVAQQISTQQLTILLAQYRQENNKLPKSPADLDNPGVFRDQWGNEMTFTFEDRGGVTKVTFRSNGPDGEGGTADDVVRTDTLPF